VLAAKFFSRLEHPSYRLPKGQVENYVNFCTLIIMHFVYHKAIIKTNYLMSIFAVLHAACKGNSDSLGLVGFTVRLVHGLCPLLA